MSILENAEFCETIERTISDSSADLRELFQAEQEKASRSGNTERETYYKTKLERLENKNTDLEQQNNWRCRYQEEINKAKAAHNEERKNYYEAKLERRAKGPVFGSETLYEKDKRRHAQEKYDQKKKMNDAEKREYMKNHGHLTSHQLKELDKLNKKK